MRLIGPKATVWWVAMANKTQPFLSHHVARALRGAVAAGVANPTVEVRLPTGATITVGGSGGTPAAVISKPGKVQPPSRSSRRSP